MEAQLLATSLIISSLVDLNGAWLRFLSAFLSNMALTFSLTGSDIFFLLLKYRSFELLVV